jgi:hypothetical protein
VPALLSRHARALVARVPVMLLRYGRSRSCLCGIAIRMLMRT